MAFLTKYVNFPRCAEQVAVSIFILKTEELNKTRHILAT